MLSDITKKALIKKVSEIDPDAVVFAVSSVIILPTVWERNSEFRTCQKSDKNVTLATPGFLHKLDSVISAVKNFPNYGNKPSFAWCGEKEWK